MSGEKNVDPDRIPENVVDRDLYKQAKQKATEAYGERTSAYKSMYMTKVYKRMGGRYKPTPVKDLQKWRDEEWVQVTPYVSSGEKIKCGAGGREVKKACRPLKSRSDSKIITLSEALKKHGRAKILELARKKNKQMAGRVNWDAGTFTPP